MLIKKPTHKNFDYQPRYYKPEEDPNEKRKKRLGFRRARKSKKKGRTPIYWLILFAIVLYIYLKFSHAI